MDSKNCLFKDSRRLVDDSHTALICRTYALGISAQCLANQAVALQRLLWACSEFLVRELHIDGAARDINDDDVAILNLADVTTCCSLRTDVTDAQA